ncbi:MAG: DUF4426 domain-containing protein [Gammaproteobacteria bacterium]|nr:DUF4426 domain-containing protein [Gammaproteobacteria bacterium]
MHAVRRTLSFLTLLIAAGGLVGCSDEGGGSTRSMPQAPPAPATSRDFGDHVLHYRAFRSDEISPQMARAHGLTRSRHRALVNIALVRKVPETIGQPVRGEVGLAARNLLGQQKSVSIREIEDGESIYYIAETSVSHNETVIFELEISPADSDTTYRLSFSQQFHTR